jgi:hypothetical protein
MPLMPIALTRSSTGRVEIPWMRASRITTVRAFPTICRGSMKLGKQLQLRSLGMRRSTVAARVS